MRKLVLVFIVFLLAGCNKRISIEKHVTVSIAPLKWVVEQIADTMVSVDVLVPEATSAENFDPSAKQVSHLAQSDIYFSVGLLGFEKALCDNIKSLGSEVKVVELKDAVDVLESDCHHQSHCHNHGDPHIWLSVVNMKCIAKVIFDELCSIYPDCRMQFECGYEKLNSELEKMQTDFSNSFTGKEKVLIVHPSLSYLARDYSFEQIPVEFEGKEPSASYIKGIFDSIRCNSIKAIYYSIQDNPVVANSIALETGIEAVEYDPLSEDWNGALIKIVNDICKRY